MAEFVAVDASKHQDDDGVYLVGVALEVSSGSNFDEYYFEQVSDFVDEYDIELGHNTIKSSDVQNRVPTFEITKAVDDIIERLANNPAIKNIHITVGWFKDDVVIGEGGKEISGIRYTDDYLSQFFPIITLWDFHRNTADWDDVPDEAWLDNVQGKITKAWKYVGNQFDLKIVPHGDSTYPSLSTADLISNNLARTLPKNKDYDELPSAAHGTVTGEYIDSSGPRVNAESVSENHENSDHIVPTHRYSIQSELHFPHPAMFIYDDIFSGFDQRVLPQTDFHAYARKWAQDNAGCVVKMEPHRLPSVVRSGDHIVYTRGTDADVPKLLRDLNPSKDIHILSSDDFLEEMEYE
ncbi:hypothetical protein LPA44_12095 [Halobacterium sp. KA-4]|uniref:hypothetical protein n=1 Tax=Halobacterium sp. KA-4 TaxID=2896367 RepID=UPI001E2DF7E6|nr:hypothetical protein [Halobacterium sp. KA-4]MCD2200634.1 hypothetical protein [Halobacterium sp. KA-4]